VATDRIDEYLAALPDWQREFAAVLRARIHEAAPGIAEAWKWNTPVFEKDGGVCAIGAFRDHVKVNFFKGASLPDPAGLFNAGLDAKASRAIDIREGDAIDEQAFGALVRAAVAQNR
jgi:hypothetical protein